MQSAHEIRVDLVRLLAATERLMSREEVSAEAGKDKHWHRFCQFLNSLGELQASLRASLLETCSLPQTTKYSAPPTAEDLAGFDRRVEVLRRKRDDMLATNAALEESKAAAVATAAAAAAAAVDEDQAKPCLRLAANATSGGPNESDLSRKRDPSRGFAALATGSKSGAHCEGGDKLWSGRGGKTRGEGSEQDADAAQADEVAEEIASMAGRLKESSMAINQTLRTQTKVLEETGDAAADNVDKVKRENVRVAERLRKKRAAMFASWCMMLTVLVTFFATYAFIILPFERRRGPFVKSNAFAHAAEQTPKISSEPQPQQQQGMGGGTKLDAAQQREFMEERKRQANKAYEERSKLEEDRQKTQNAGLRLVAEEKERYRQRHTEKMLQNARDRKRGKIEALENDISKEDNLKARGLEGAKTTPPPQKEEAQKEHQLAGSQSGNVVAVEGAAPDEQAERGDADGEGGGGDEPVSPQELRRLAQEEYVARSQSMKAQQISQNADLRRVAEEKDRYRERQAKRMSENARQRNRAKLEAEESKATEDALKARAIGEVNDPEPTGEKLDRESTSDGQQGDGIGTESSADDGTMDDTHRKVGDRQSEQESAESAENFAEPAKSGLGFGHVRSSGGGNDEVAEGGGVAESLDAVRRRLKESLGKTQSGGRDEL